VTGVEDGGGGGQCCGIEQLFSPRLAALELKRYRRRGPARTTRLLLDSLRRLGVRDRSLLDIGGGVGAIQHELAADGVASIHSVEGATAYLHAARQEAERRGYAQRVNYLSGDFVELAPQVPPADLVTLDRVICCYDNLEPLLSGAAARATLALALVYPRDAWRMRVGGRHLINAVARLRRLRFRFFVHPEAAVDSLARGAGLIRHSHRRTFLWNVVTYVREAA
jgi:hypothetical protein